MSVQSARKDRRVYLASFDVGVRSVLILGGTCTMFVVLTS